MYMYDDQIPILPGILSTVCIVLCLGLLGNGRFSLNCSISLQWHWGNHTIAMVDMHDAILINSGNDLSTVSAK